MCFSAEASFGAGMVLSVVGIATISKVNNRSQLAFACIPLIFAIQQLTEGCVWLALENPEYSSWLQPSTYIFLILAQAIWPSLVPISILLVEDNPSRKKVLAGLSIIGLIVSVFLSYRLLTQEITASIGDNHILYNLGVSPAIISSFGILYFIATIVPSFVSSVKKMRLLGLTILLSFILTTFFYENYVISVWCFFAAIMSVIVLRIISGQQQAFKKSSLAMDALE